MTTQQADDLDVVFQFLSRETQDLDSYWNLLKAFLVQKGKAQNTNWELWQTIYWEMIVYKILQDGYYVLQTPITQVPKTFKRTIAGHEFAQAATGEWQGRPYSYALHHHHH